MRRNNWMLMVALAATLGVSSACGTAQPTAVEIAAPAAEPTAVTDHEEGSFEISCPVGVVCDETYSDRAYAYESDRAWIRLSFEPSIIGATDIEDFRADFVGLSMRIDLPERSPGTSWTPRGATPDVVFHSFDDGRLRFTVTGVIDQLTDTIERPDDPDCITDDIAGICSESTEADIPFELAFDLSIPAEPDWSALGTTPTTGN